MVMGCLVGGNGSLPSNLVGSAWVPAAGGRTFESRSPADGRKVVGVFPRSGREEVEAAVAAAKGAYDAWRLTPPPLRGAVLRQCAAVLRDRKEKLSKLMSFEMGKPLVESRGDVQEAIDCAEYYSGEGRRLFGDTSTSELPSKFAMAVRVPVGVCGMITPWNFPVAIPAWKIFPAILCGNTVVFKPAEDSPACGAAFAAALRDAGVPPGVVNLVQGFGEEVGAALVHHPDVRLISFTGSCETGSLIAGACGQNLKRCSLEMGGKNAQIVMDDADLDLALEGALWGAFGTAGQRCTATSRLILHRKIKRTFVKRLVAAAQKLRLGDPLNERHQIGPLVNEAQRERVERYVAIGQEEGAKLLCGGRRPTGAAYKHGWYYEPTVFDGVTPDMRIAQEEIFGPVTAAIEVNSFEQAVEVLNGTAYGLSSSIYTRDVNRAFRAIRDLEAGITYINGPTIGAEVHMPFGGVKNTGNGHREAGQAVLDVFSEWKSVYVDYSGKLQKAQIDVQA
ncbi:MAG: aldehyde dehydrogenase [Planctomycetota bacterium]